MPRKPRFHLPGVPQHVIQRGNKAPFLKPHKLYLVLGITRDERLFAYREFFRRYLDENQVHAITIREALNQELVLGREDFKDVIARMKRRQV